MEVTLKNYFYLLWPLFTARPIQLYRFQPNLNWCYGTIKNLQKYIILSEAKS